MVRKANRVACVDILVRLAYVSALDPPHQQQRLVGDLDDFGSALKHHIVLKLVVCLADPVGNNTCRSHNELWRSSRPLADLSSQTVWVIVMVYFKGVIEGANSWAPCIVFVLVALVVVPTEIG